VRKATVFLTGGAIVLLAAAAALRFAVVPGLQQLPDNLDTTLRFAGTADLFDPTVLQTGDTSRAVRSGVPVAAEQRVRVTSTSGQTAVVTDETTVTGPGNSALSTLKSTWAVDRKTLGPAPAPSGATVQPHDGLVIGFPLEPEPQHYPYWDSLTQTAATAAYQRAERHAGRDTYVYMMYATGVLRDTALVAGLPTTLSKELLFKLAASMPADVQQGLAASASLLPEQLPLTYNAIGDSTFWVDIETGYVVDVTRKQTVTVSLSLGPTVIPLATVFALDIRFTPDTVKTISDDATQAEQGVTLLETTAPLVLVVLAVLLVLLAVLLAVRRRTRRAPVHRTPAPPTETAPTPAPTAAAPPTAVGASDEG
jgi:hypothetical protein